MVFLCVGENSSALFELQQHEFWRCINISSKELSVNENIRFKEVRTIGSDGSQLGILPIAKALDAAYAADLDLVCISPNAAPPVCKIMDYGKYRFEQAKREKEAKKNQKTVEVKEIRLGLSIDKGFHPLQRQRIGSPGNRA